MDAPPAINPTLVDFHPVASDKRGALEVSFLKDFGPVWADIIKRNKLRLSFFNCNLPEVYLCMIIGPNDRVLMELAQKYQFPRGCPVLWRPDPLSHSGHIHTYGFFPKFDNDERQEADDLSTLENILEVSAFEKWSGFLGQLLTFSIVASDGRKQNYWTATSKNSADSASPFVQNAKRLFAPHLTPILVSELNDRTMHLCAEMISQNDQMHGAIVLKETAVITAVGQGIQRSTPIPDASTLTTFLSPRDLVEFCHRHNLPCGSLVVVDNPPDAQRFLKQLSEARDWMTASHYEQLVQKSGGKLYAGTIKHTNVLGEVLEGLVLRLSLATTGQMVKKYKFPRYTVRTMFLRPYISSIVTDGLSAAVAIDMIERFCDHWCVSAAGKDYWRNWAAQAILLLMANKIPKHPEVADHIITAELTDPAPEAFRTLYDMSKVADDNAGQVIIVVGPVGGGKSTVAQALSQVTNNALHIDGDILDLARGTVLRLSAERNDYTIFQIIKAFMQGKTPVISTGGGVLFENSYGSKNKEPTFILDSRLHRTLGIRPKIIVFVPESTNLEKIYGDRDRVHQVVLQRLKTGEWLLPEKYPNPEAFAKFIGGLSEANLKFAKKLMEEADEVHTYPLVTEKNHDQVAKMVFPLSPVVNNRVRSARFNQVRYLVEITPVSDTSVIMGHVTWQYDAVHAITLDMAQLNVLMTNPLTIGDVPGFIVTIPEIGSTGTKNKKKKEISGIQFAVPQIPIHEDCSTHITIDPGSHAPVCMKTAALAFLAKQTTVELPIRNSSNIKTYDLQSASVEKCTLRFLSVFGI